MLVSPCSTMYAWPASSPSDLKSKAPLYDAKGKLAFFIGGQVNCSTTIHSNVDVMKVLSLSSGEEPEENESLRAQSVHKQPVPMRPSARRALLKAFGVRIEEQIVTPTGDAGMEDGVLNRMEGQDLSSQMKEFYTAYSKASTTYPTSLPCMVQ